jgi:hypothetical protein
MNDELKSQKTAKRRKRGQTLAEFALTLPFLLLLVFGVIEFARIFQAWVTIQNAARTATRLASTGQISERYEDLDTLVPCVLGDERGTKDRIAPIAGLSDYFVEVFSGGTESLFATWYDGEDCDPGDSNDQVRRRDIARIASITDEARRGAAGLSKEDSTLLPTQASIQDHLYSVWEQPMAGSDEPGWLNVMICSNRPRFGDLLGGDRAFDDTEAGLRFTTVLEESQDVNGGFYDLPYCMLNEIRASVPEPVPDPGTGSSYNDDTVNTNNAGRRWLDPGGPGNRVTVVVTFNHPLITPIGLGPYIQLEARRAAVNESFIQAQAVGALQGGKPSIPSGPTPTPIQSPVPPDTEVPPPTQTFTPIPPSPTDTETPPFDCDRIHVENVDFFQNRFYIDVSNDNGQPTDLVRVQLNWSDTANWNALFADYPDMFLDGMYLDSIQHWDGPDNEPNTDTLIDPGWIESSDRTIPPLGSAVWEGYFNNGPLLLNNHVTQWDFGSSTFFFSNPSGGAACEISLYLPPEPDPTEIPDDADTPTATFTPDCASENMRVVLESFQTAGEVRLLVINNWTAVAPFTGFEINWIKRSTALQLAKVSVGGDNADDGVTVWEGPDADPATNSYTEGTWLTDFTFPPSSTTALWLDFQGTASDLPTAFGVTSADFNGTWFEISCGSSSSSSGGDGGDGGGGSSGDSGFIFLSDVPTPPPTNTPRPTNTLGPTLTPSITRTPAPPTQTFSPAPPTSTRTTSPPTPTFTPTEGAFGGSGGTGGSG